MNLLAIALLFFILAAVLAFVDLFLPTGGVLSILGGLCAITCVTFAFQHSIFAGTIAVVMVVAAAPLLFAAAVKIWPLTPLGKRLLLKQPEKTSGQRVATEIEDARQFIGHELVLDASIFPSGTAELEGETIRITAQGGYLEAKTRVRLVDYRDREYVVRPITSAPTGAPRPNEAPGSDAAQHLRDRQELAETDATPLQVQTSSGEVPSSPLPSNPAPTNPAPSSPAPSNPAPSSPGQSNLPESGNLLDLPTDQFELEYELDNGLAPDDSSTRQQHSEPNDAGSVDDDQAPPDRNHP
ncbi:MAG TPA: hypothetical protein DDW52_17625 [Planctomycetaceae bacterium]|nr:hypothetical protein [Planctomycetaceae bacterium]